MAVLTERPLSPEQTHSVVMRGSGDKDPSLHGIAVFPYAPLLVR